MIRTVEKTNIALVDTHLKQVRTSVLAAKKGENSGTDAASSVEQNSGDKEVTRIRDTSKEEAEIGRTSTRTCYACMYALYGLTEDEIKIIEGK